MSKYTILDTAQIRLSQQQALSFFQYPTKRSYPNFNYENWSYSETDSTKTIKNPKTKHDYSVLSHSTEDNNYIIPQDYEYLKIV